LQEMHPFTPTHYREILTAALKSGYSFRLFGEPAEDLTVYLRHDVDNSIADALAMAKSEQSLGVRSTYLFLMRSRNYNVLSGQSIAQIRDMAAMGHDIGLHHSCETGETLANGQSLAARIRADAALMSEQIDIPVGRFSLHNPAESDNFKLDVPGLINTYSAPYFKNIKYISESNFKWREGCPCAMFRERRHNVMQVLVHPMSYVADLSGDRDALLYFLRQKVCVLSKVNQEQNRTLRAEPVTMDEIADYLKAHP